MVLNIEINDTQRAIAKIKKLLALGENGGTQHEAFSAMQKAQALLIKHGLEMDSVKETDSECYERNDSYMDKRNAPWKNYIWNGLAKLYFCTFFYNKYSGNYTLVGKPSNIEVCKYLIQYIIRTGEALAKKEADSLPTGSRRSYKHSFLTAFSYTIQSRCFEEIRRAKEEGIKDETTGNMLIVHPLYTRAAIELEEALKQMKVAPKTSNYSPYISNQSGARNGAKAGASISLRANALNEENTLKYIGNN